MVPAKYAVKEEEKCCGKVSMAKTAMLAGQMMSEANAEAKRVEQTILIMMNTAYQDVEVLAHYADILLRWQEEGVEHIEMIRIHNHRYHLGHIDKINNLSRKVVKEKISCVEANKVLTDMKKYDDVSMNKQRIGILFLGTAFSMVFKGNVFDVLITTFLGIIYLLLWELHRKGNENELLHFLFSSMLLSISLQYINQFVFPIMHEELIIVSSIMPMVPGIGITTALMDILNKDYVTGIVKLVEALVQALAIAFGIGLGKLIGGF